MQWIAEASRLKVLRMPIALNRQVTNVIGAAEIEFKHIGKKVVTQRILVPGSAQVAFIYVNTVNGVVLYEKSRMLAGAARNIEDSSRARHQSVDQVAQTLAFTSIILVA